MKAKNIVVSVLLMSLLVMGVGAVAAQDDIDRDGRGPGVLRLVVETIAGELGMEPRELVREVRGGSTVADVIVANGGDVDAITTLAIDAATTAINEGITSGRIPAERGERLLANIDQLVTDGINGDLRPPRGPRPGRPVERPVIDAVLDATGLTPQEIREEMRAGATLAEVITNHGGNVDEIIDLAVAAATERINQAIDNERISPERGQEMLENLEERITERFNTPLPERPARGEV